MKLALAIVPVLVSLPAAAADIWECSYNSDGGKPLVSHLQVLNDTLLVSVKAPPIAVPDGPPVDINSLFSGTHRILTNDQTGLVAVLSIVWKNPQGQVYVGTETIVLNKETGASRMAWVSADEADVRRTPVYGRCHMP
jgi:hypothetical protein